MSPIKKKRAQPANTEIIREQIQLMQTEKELKKSLDTVNDHINKLLVEELELKSALARSQSSQKFAAAPKQERIDPVYQFDSVSIINEQKLNLFTDKRSQSMEEYEDE